MMRSYPFRRPMLVLAALLAALPAAAQPGGPPSPRERRETLRPVYLALNHLNRAMGQNDFYPFALPPTVLLKLEYVHQLVRMAARL